jgi:hypothetical protein
MRVRSQRQDLAKRTLWLQKTSAMRRPYQNKDRAVQILTVIISTYAKGLARVLIKKLSGV